MKVKKKKKNQLPASLTGDKQMDGRAAKAL